MTNVLQLTKRLDKQPTVETNPFFLARHYGGPKDIGPWLELRRAAFARERLGVREWDQSDFEAEFLARWWWRPERMWLAEAASLSIPAAATPGTCPLVGTVTLAFRGTGPDARPVVHWLAVHPRWRRRSVGRGLMSRLEACAWDLGYRQLWLETHAQWHEAAALYLALGYEPA